MVLLAKSNENHLIANLNKNYLNNLFTMRLCFFSTPDLIYLLTLEKGLVVRYLVLKSCLRRIFEVLKSF